MEKIKIKDGFKGERSLVLPDMAQHMSMDDPVLCQLHITDIGYYPHATYHYRERTQPIDQYVLIYCVRGSGRYSVEGRSFEVHANQFFILPAMKPHSYASNNDDPWTIYWVHFCGVQAASYAEGLLQPVEVSAGLTSRIADRNDVFEEIFMTLSDGMTTDNLRYAASMLHFYLGSLRYLPLYRKYHKHETAEENDTVVNAALRFMTENIETTLSLHQIARYVGYSPSHFSALFKARTGHSPLNYFNRMKIQRACELLDTTDMKINQISCKVGIDDSFYFSRLFSKIVGISPRKYRGSKK